MTCGSGLPNCRANSRNFPGVNFWLRNTSTCEAKNASHTSRKSVGIRSASAPKPSLNFLSSMHREQLLHAPAGELRIGEQPGGVSETEQLRKVQDVSCRLLSADHHEVLLVAVQPGHEYD